MTRGLGGSQDARIILHDSMSLDIVRWFSDIELTRFSLALAPAHVLVKTSVSWKCQKLYQRSSKTSISNQRILGKVGKRRMYGSWNKRGFYAKFAQELWRADLTVRTWHDRSIRISCYFLSCLEAKLYSLEPASNNCYWYWVHIRCFYSFVSEPKGWVGLVFFNWTFSLFGALCLSHWKRFRSTQQMHKILFFKAISTWGS